MNSRQSWLFNKLRRLLPNTYVRKIVDAKHSVTVSVIREDSKTGRRKDPQACALARACVRSKMADAAIIGIGSSYLVKDGVATRYETSEGVGREITSFDRHHDFATGKDYVLGRVPPTKRLGYQRRKPGPHDGGRGGKHKKPVSVHVRHHTTRIRVMKG